MSAAVVGFITEHQKPEGLSDDAKALACEKCQGYAFYILDTYQYACIKCRHVAKLGDVFRVGILT